MFPLCSESRRLVGSCSDWLTGRRRISQYFNDSELRPILRSPHPTNIDNAMVVPEFEPEFELGGRECCFVDFTGFAGFAWDEVSQGDTLS